ncbi:MAG: type II secretion system F family protein [Planctomycetaceae bacterium]
MLAQAQAHRPMPARPAFRGILKEDVRYAVGNENSTSDAVNGWFDRLMLQSGIETAPSVWLSLCVVSGLAFGGTMFLVTEQFLLTAFAAIAGMALPLGIAMLMRSRRQKQIMEQLPAAAEELARAARTGRNVENSFLAVAADTPAPLGSELRLAARRTEMGIDLASAVRDLPERTGVSTLTMLTSAIGVHQDTGGDLVSVLERMATSVRDRLHFNRRLRAATIASRLGATMMLVIPPAVVAFYLFRDPNYLQNLMASYWGRLSLFLAIGLQIIGATLVYRILRNSGRF